MKKFKSTFIIGFLMIGSIIYLNKQFGGIVAGKLPFEPFSLIRGITHRGIQGTDYTQFSFMFIYILTGMIFKNNV